MKIVIVKSGNELLIGKCGLFSGAMPAELISPMLVITETVRQPPKLAGGPAQTLNGFRLVPFSCSKIILGVVSYYGEVDAVDPMFEVYGRVLEAIKEQHKSPLLIQQ